MFGSYIKFKYSYKNILTTFFGICSTVFFLILPINVFLYFFVILINVILLTIFNKILFNKKINTYIYINFFCLVFFGLLYASNAYNTYGNFFGTTSDDSFYFYRAMDIMNGIDIGASSLFEYILAFLLKIISYFTNLDKFSVIYLLPFSYTFISLGIESMNHLYCMYHNTALPLKYYCIFIVLNQNIINNCVPLYRESYAIFLFLLGIYYIEKNIKINLIIVTALLFNIRGAFALILVSFYVLRIVYKRKYKLVYIIGILLTFLLAYSIFDYLAPYLSFSGSDISTENLLRSRLSFRTERLTGYFSLLYSNPILRIIYFLFVPNQFVEFHGIYEVVQHVSTWNSVSYSTEMYNWLAILNWITIMILPYTIPRTVIGIINMIKNKEKNTVAFGLFMIYSWALIAVFSMQVRHFTILIILFPIFYGYWNKTKTKLLNQICNILTLSSYLMIFILNII